MVNTAVNPASHDQYFNTINVKYLTGLVSTSTGTVQSHSSYSAHVASGFKVRGRIQCDRKIEITADDGNVYYIPLFIH